MKDNEARQQIAVLEERIRHLQHPMDLSSDVEDLIRRFMELVKELGFSYDDDLVFNREAKANSALGRLQLQISALVSALGFEETYEKGELVYKKPR